MSRDCRAPRCEYNGHQSQAQMNAIILKETGFDAKGQQNLEGTLKLFNDKVKVLFDTGSSNSFISIRMMNDLGLVPQEPRLF